ncbi:MAG: hypothetical protein AMXMBFR13_39110 [Phycisphaerae bacterium]
MKPLSCLIGLAMGLAGIPLLGGCESTGGHRIKGNSEGHVMACQMCYDEAKVTQEEFVKGVFRDRVIKEHMCPGCKAEVSTRIQDGRPVIKCEKCAPAGVECDRCLPPREKS